MLTSSILARRARIRRERAEPGTVFTANAWGKGAKPHGLSSKNMWMSGLKSMRRSARNSDLFRGQRPPHKPPSKPN